MTTEELIEKLKQYPGKQVAVVDWSTRYGGDAYSYLDTELQVRLAVDHSGNEKWPKDDEWRWANQEGPDGREVVVLR